MLGGLLFTIASIRHIPLTQDLESVVSASPASQDATLPTLVNEDREHVGALLAAAWTRTPSPPVVIALVVFYQVPLLSLDSGLPSSRVNLGDVVGPVHDRIRSGEQAVLVPLRALARLPAIAADVAELVATATG